MMSKSKKKKTKYYCGLCEKTHALIKDYATCSNCGRDYCHDSIKECIAVGVNKCPFCQDSLFEEFINYKEIVFFEPEEITEEEVRSYKSRFKKSGLIEPIEDEPKKIIAKKIFTTTKDHEPVEIVIAPEDAEKLEKDQEVDILGVPIKRVEAKRPRDKIREEIQSWDTGGWKGNKPAPYNLSIELKISDNSSEIIYWNELPERTKTLIEKIVRRFDFHYKEVMENYEKAINLKFLVAMELDLDKRHQYATKLLYAEYRGRLFGEKEDPRYELEKVKVQAMGDQLAKTEPQWYGLEAQRFKNLGESARSRFALSGGGTNAFLERRFGNYEIPTDIIRYLRQRVTSWYREESGKEKYDKFTPLDWHQVNVQSQKLLEEYTEILQEIPEEELLRALDSSDYDTPVNPKDILELLSNAIKEHQSKFYRRFNREIPIKSLMGAEWNKVHSYVVRDLMKQKAEAEGKVLVWQDPDDEYTDPVTELWQKAHESNERSHWPLLLAGFVFSLVIGLWQGITSWIWLYALIGAFVFLFFYLGFRSMFMYLIDQKWFIIRRKTPPEKHELDLSNFKVSKEEDWGRKEIQIIHEVDENE